MSRQKRTYRLLAPTGTMLEMTTKHNASWVYQFAKRNNPEEFNYIGIFQPVEYPPVANHVIIEEV